MAFQDYSINVTVDSQTHQLNNCICMYVSTRNTSLTKQPCFFVLLYMEWRKVRKTQLKRQFKDLRLTNVIAKGIVRVHPYCKFYFQAAHSKNYRLQIECWNQFILISLTKLLFNRVTLETTRPRGLWRASGIWKRFAFSTRSSQDCLTLCNIQGHD